MFGSLFYNFWAALFSFTGYFIWAIRNPFAMPLQTIAIAFVVAIVGFIVMFIIRYFLGYVFYTPETSEFPEMDDELIAAMAEDETNQQFVPLNSRSTTEFEDENTEDVAQVVRTMLHGDEALS